MITKKIKFTPKKIVNLLAVFTILIIFLVMIFVFDFLYKNFYQTLTLTKEISINEINISTNKIEMEKFNVIINKITEKTSAKKPDNIISPFR